MRTSLIAILCGITTWLFVMTQPQLKKSSLSFLQRLKGINAYFLALFLFFSLLFMLFGLWLLPGWSGAVIGIASGIVFAHNYKRRYLEGLAEQMARQIAETLELIGRAMAIGFNLHQGLGVAAHEIPPPFGTYLKQIKTELDLGLDLEQVLRNLSKRVPDPELELAIMAMVVQNRLGGALTKVLGEAAATIRQRIHTRRRILTLTTQGRVTGVVVALLPLVVLLLQRWLAPEIVAPMFTQPQGQLLLTFAAILELSGLYTIRRLCSLRTT